MLAKFVRTLRLLAIVALLIGSATSLHAVAGEGVIEGANSVHAQHRNVSDETTPNACQDFCQQSSPCCVMGHCLVGIMILESDGLPSLCRPVLNALQFSTLIGGLAVVPYRPPAAV
jgi:hypothetical protein